MEVETLEWDEIFNVKRITYENVEISVFEVKELNRDIIQILDENLIKICEGKNSHTDINIVKRRVQKLFNGKNNSWKMGAIAEFFIHLYLSLSEYDQDCMFLNLEEQSIKKGFDGYYHFDNEHWIMESKSGSILSKNISHKKKLNEAIIDLQDKFEGNSNNNPWQEAYNHACHYDVGSPEDVRNIINKFSNDYFMNEFHHLNEFNIIPCATIFLENVWNPKDQDHIIKEAKEVIKGINYKRVHLICVTQGNINIFINYIFSTI